MKISNFTEAQVVLRPFYDYSHTSYTLDTMRELMAFLGNPQDKFKVIHVAGTSGKTSTAYYVSALLETTGAKVGLTVSPHVDAMNERVQINHAPLPEAQFCATLGEFLEVIEPSGIKPSYFELMVSLAYWEFARQKVDYAVIEVGLGGLLDGTNVVNRPDKICLITDIGLDHTEILGDTLRKIATQKAGIIQDHNQVFMYQQSADVMEVVKKRVDEQHATLHLLTADDQIKISDLPPFQQRNLGLATAAVRSVKPLNSDQIKQAAKVHIPARFERFEVGDKTIIVDGSHNAQKLTALLQSIQALYPDQKLTALVAFVGGHDQRWQDGIQVLLPALDDLIITGFSTEQDVPKQSVDPEKVAEFCRQQGFTKLEVIADPAEAFQALQKRQTELAVVAGSFYLLNHIRPLIV